jgi:hypothetical protein
VSEWTIVFDRSIDLDSWSEGVSIEALASLHDWLATCREDGPPADAWLTELEDGYRYRYWLIEVNVTIEFLAVTHERWMLVRRIL